MKQISENFEDIKSSYCAKRDTRNNWVTMMFATKYRYNCFLKQSHIDTCSAAFREFESIGFEFGDLGFGGNHVHFMANVPKRYSIQDAEIMLKSRSSLRIFEKHPGFRKRYPRGSFWSSYEHHESAGRQNFEEASAYIRNQEWHHEIVVINDKQQKLNVFAAERDATSPTIGGLGEERGGRGL
jgi:REP element-mobilizing transposase RayT